MVVYIDDMLVKSLNAGDHLKHLPETFDILREHNMKLNPGKCAFGVNSECQQALKDFKKYLSCPPLLSKPKEGEILLAYHGVLEVVVSAVLVREDEGTQSPIYYVSKILTGVETLYPHLKKLALALVVAAQKLRPYFQCHPIVVVTTFPLRNILHKPDLSSRLAKWAVKMSEFDIEYKPRTTIKSQVLADFMADLSMGLLPLAATEEVMVSESTSGVWTLFTDRASNVKGSGLGIVLTTPSGETLRQAIRMIPLTNNEVKYEALIVGLELARGLDSDVIEIKCDSQLVVNQVYGIFDTKEQCTQQYVAKVQALLAQFRERSITHIPREENTEADALANLGTSTEIKGSELGMVVQLMNSVLDTDGYYEVNSASLVWDWRNEIIDYLEHGKLPEDPKASRALRAKAACYSFKKGQLYRKSFQGPLAQCLGASEANYVMREVHERICGNHSVADLWC
ncbi:PREDICTED: uncharacterized protein LOC109234769 [Nicotiana attenuata]|uniref:uncharacterized protein LOC109234769 n=1 Tax=Nicotiana attenuata TaxID=49451 RepID=UPI00090471E0|nr:PREDICTED: uncharacterized protein LOC109234769 [Nicotiana attenuata]